MKLSAATTLNISKNARKLFDLALIVAATVLWFTIAVTLAALILLVWLDTEPIRMLG